MRVQPAPRPLQLVHVDVNDLKDADLTSSESIAWAVACSNHSFWCIRLSEIAKRSGRSEKSVQRAFTKKRNSGELLALKLRKKNGTFAEMVYIIHHEPLSPRQWVSLIQDIDFEKWTTMCFESVNLEKSERDKLTPPKRTKPSEYDLIYNRDGILEQRSKNSKKPHLKIVEPTTDQLTEYCSFVDQDDDLLPGVLSDYAEYEADLDPANMRVPATGQTTRVDKCPPNKLINTRANSEKHLSDDDTTVPKITENKLMPNDFQFDAKVQKRLEVKHQIPSEFISTSLARCIRHNRKNPPRKSVDWNNWAEKWVLDDWREYKNSADYQQSSKPMPRNWGLEKDFFDVVIKDSGLLETDLIDLIAAYRDRFLNTGIHSYDWEGDCVDWIFEYLNRAA